MKPFPKIHDLYIRSRRASLRCWWTWAIVLGLDLVQALLIGEMGDIGEGNYDFVQRAAARGLHRAAPCLTPCSRQRRSSARLMGLGQLGRQFRTHVRCARSACRAAA
jgi:hypothetical protein